MSKDKKTVIFDLDGTLALIDTNETTLEVLCGMRKWIKENGFVTEKQRKKMTIESKKVKLAISECGK